jgi:hypothetical protein
MSTISHGKDGDDEIEANSAHLSFKCIKVKMKSWQVGVRDKRRWMQRRCICREVDVLKIEGEKGMEDRERAALHSLQLL